MMRQLSEYEELFEDMEDAEDYLEENDDEEYIIEPVEYGKAYGLLPKEKAEEELLDPLR